MTDDQDRDRDAELADAYEELRTSHEELETTNEELQATIEELETTNEMLVSTNDELARMNAEASRAHDELARMNAEARRTDELAGVTELRARFGAVESDVRFHDWISLHFAVCSQCSATIIDHMDLKANHAAWHARNDTPADD